MRVVGAQRPQRLPVEPQQAVGIVLDHEQAGPLADLQHPGPALHAEGHPAGVVEGRDRVEELHPLALAGQPGERLRQRLRDEPAVIHRDVDDVRLVGREGAQRPDIGRPLGQHDVAGVDEDPGDQVQRLLRADRDDHLVRVGADPLQCHHVTDALAQAGISLRRHVLQGHGAAVGHELAGHLADSVQRQGGDVGHAARQRHDLGPGSDGEQGPDLGRDHLLGPRGVAADIGVHQGPMGRGGLMRLL